MQNLFKNPNLTPPNGEKKVLLHSCCAPCTCEILETLTFAGIKLTLFFYNPNIHPKEEYEFRKEEIIRFAGKLNIPFIDTDYKPNAWFQRVQGLELEPERGRRCSACFDVRLEQAAALAAANDFKVFTSSFGLSRWKDFDQVNASGTRAASRYPELTYWTYNWRKDGGSKRMYAISKREQFYRQEYCGCLYSLRDTNLKRVRSGKNPVSNERKFYSPRSETLPDLAQN